MGDSNEFLGTHIKEVCACVRVCARPAAKVFVIQEGSGSASDSLLVSEGPLVFFILSWCELRRSSGTVFRCGGGAYRANSYLTDDTNYGSARVNGKPYFTVVGCLPL